MVARSVAEPPRAIDGGLTLELKLIALALVTVRGNGGVAVEGE